MSTTALLNLINFGWNVKVYHQSKRIDGHMVSRVCWHAEKNGTKCNSLWPGHDNAEDAITVMINVISQVSA